MSAPTLEPITFEADDQPYNSGLGYQEKMQKLANNQILVAAYLATIEAAMEIGQLGYEPQGSWDASGDTYPVPVANGTWILSAAGTLGGEALLKGDVIVYSGGEWIHVRVGSSKLSDDPSPQLAGVLDPNGHGQNDAYLSVSSVAGTTTLDCTKANAFSTVLTENTTIALSGLPAAGTGYFGFLEIYQDVGASGYTLAFPAGFEWSQGNALVMTPTASAKDVVAFFTRDGGATVTWFICGQAVA